MATNTMRTMVRNLPLLLGWLAGLSLAALMVLMVIDVSGRYLFNQPVPGAGEMIELLMGIVVFAALPLTTISGEHISIDYGQAVLPAGWARVVKVLVDVATASILALLAWRLLVKTGDLAFYSDTTPFLRLPLAPVAGFLTFATALAALLLLFNAVRGAAPRGTAE